MQKIRAFFTFKGKKEEMELAAAEVNQEGVFLHPISDPEHVIFVKSNSVDITISSDGEIDESDIEIRDKKSSRNREPEGNDGIMNISPDDEERNSYIRPRDLKCFMPTKKRFSVMLYEDEYNMLMNNMNSSGYKKTEYFLACMTSAKKKSMEALYKQYTAEYKQRRSSDMAYARQAQAEDYATRKSSQAVS